MDKYKLTINRFTKKKQYAIGFLVYPGLNKETQWNYFFGAVLIVHQFKKHKWFYNCDFIILTPIIENKEILELIKRIFDVHAIYNTSLKLNATFEYAPRWHGVFNKLYFWDSNSFSYTRLVIMDTDIYITNPSGYVKLFTQLTGEIAGSYENSYVNKNVDPNLLLFNVPIDPKYTSYTWNDGKSYYNMVNAGVLSIIPNKLTLQTMINDLEAGWTQIDNKYPALQGKKGNYIFPEQEYLTGFFTGKWKNLPCSEFMSLYPTANHYGYGPDKFWDIVPANTAQAQQIKDSINELFNHYPQLKNVCKINNYYYSSNSIVINPIKPKISKITKPLKSTRLIGPVNSVGLKNF